MNHLYESLDLKECKQYLADLLNLESKNVFDCTSFREEEVEVFFTYQRQTNEIAPDILIKLLARAIFTILSSKDSIGKL